MKIRIAIFADVNPNAIDGSVIWFQSIINILSRIDGVSVLPIVRENIRSSFFTSDIEESGVIERIQVLPGYMESDNEFENANVLPNRLRSILSEKLKKDEIDICFIRGDVYLDCISEDPLVASRCWGYWINRPVIVDPQIDRVKKIADRLMRVVVQTPVAAAAFESIIGISSNKIVILPPSLPDMQSTGTSILPMSFRDIGVIYTGKMDQDYNVEVAAGLPSLFNLHDITESVHMVGDKFNKAASDSSFVQRMRRQLEATQGLTWHKRASRSDTLRLLARSRFSFSWRSSRYRNSLEISTKLLESCALGVPPLLNRTYANVSLLGETYPYYVSQAKDIVDAVKSYSNNAEKYLSVSNEISNISKEYSFDKTSSILRVELRRLSINNSRGTVSKPIKIVFAGHDFKFLQQVIDIFQGNNRFEIRVDKWHTTRTHNEEQSNDCLAWGDVFFCEWCVGAAVWYSNRVSKNQKCLVRMHRFEAFIEDPKNVNFDNVDSLIVVSSYFRDICMTNFGVSSSKIRILPQYVDCHLLNRPKHAWAHRTIGLVGINGFFHKRPDRALDLLDGVLELAPHWRLRIRSVMPWDIDWIWKQRQGEVEAFKELFARIVGTPRLRQAIHFDTPGGDMAEWYRHVGVIASTSDSEGCHTSVAEGMASGAFPVIYGWPGAESIYPKEAVSTDLDDLVKTVLASDDINNSAPIRREDIRKQAAEFDIHNTVQTFTSLI